MKKTFETPVITAVYFEDCDIITNSIVGEPYFPNKQQGSKNLDDQW